MIRIICVCHPSGWERLLRVGCREMESNWMPAPQTSGGWGICGARGEQEQLQEAQGDLGQCGGAGRGTRRPWASLAGVAGYLGGQEAPASSAGQRSRLGGSGPHPRRSRRGGQVRQTPAGPAGLPRFRPPGGEALVPPRPRPARANTTALGITVPSRRQCAGRGGAPTGGGDSRGQCGVAAGCGRRSREPDPGPQPCPCL